jgi:hypothetical protein
VDRREAAERAKIEELARKTLERKGWDIIYKLDIVWKNTPQFFEAGIMPDDWNIQIVFSPGFEKTQLEILKDANIEIDAPVEKAIYAIMEHEYGHWNRCPIDTDIVEVVMSRICKGLQKGGIIDKGQVEQLTPLVSNMFCDVVVNGTAILSDNRFKEGATIFQTDRAYTASAQLSHDMTQANETGQGSDAQGGQRQKWKPHFPDFFALFVDAHMKLARGDSTARGVAERYCNDYSKLQSTSRKLLVAMIGGELAEKAMADKLSDADARMAKRMLMDENRWAAAAEEFAKIMAPYLKKDIKFIGIYPMDGLFKKFKEDEDFRREIIRRGLLRGDPVEYVNDTEKLDEAYKQAAAKMVIEFDKDQNKQQQRTTLFDMSRKRLREGEAIRGNIDWGRTIFVKGEPWLYKKDTPYDINKSGLSQTGSMEDLVFVIDVSASMGWSGKPLDGSRYDMCIRSVYSAVKYLEDSGKAQFMRFGLILFGNQGRTEWSGWRPYQETDKLKERLFTGWKGAGETALDPEKLQSVMDSADGNFMVLMVSDAEINANEEATLSKCKEIVSNGNDFVLFEVMDRNRFAEEMKKAGATVVQVDRPEDLVGLVLKATKNKYKRIGRNSVAEVTGLEELKTNRRGEPEEGAKERKRTKI